MLSALLILLQTAAVPPPPPLLRSTTTMTGQPITLPRGTAELTVSRRVLPAGGRLPTHKHPWQRYVLVESGRIVVVNHDARVTREFGPGEVMVESVGQWHEGRVVGDSPVSLLVFDQAPPGRSNIVLKD